MKEVVVSFIKDNLKNPKFYAWILVILIVALLLFPYIDANFFYYDRVEKRVNLLKELSEIDRELLLENPVLENEYQSILLEIEKQKDGSIGSVFITKSTPEIRTLKFLTGGVPSFLLAILCLFIKFTPKWHKIIGVVCCVFLGAILGYISQLIPTIIQPTCNYIGMPLLQIVLLCIAILSSSAKKNTSK